MLNYKSFDLWWHIAHCHIQRITYSAKCMQCTHYNLSQFWVFVRHRLSSKVVQLFAHIPKSGDNTTFSWADTWFMNLKFMKFGYFVTSSAMSVCVCVCSLCVHFATSSRLTAVQFNCRFCLNADAAMHVVVLRAILSKVVAKNHCHLWCLVVIQMWKAWNGRTQTHSSRLGRHYSGNGHAQFMPQQRRNCTL